MKKIEYRREVVSSPPSPEYLEEKAKQGWKLVAVEWEREVEPDRPDADRLREELPFGLRVADDCMHLEEHPIEKQAMMLMLDLIVQDKPLSQVAEELNQRGFRTRRGLRWNQVSVFHTLPRLIEVGPQIFSSQEWQARRRHLLSA